jgi:cbb3-type cytochrome oxidase subunit 1
MQAFSDWLAATWLSQLFADASWFVPTVQTVHILCIAVVVTTLGMLDFRLLRLTRSGPAVETMAAKFVPWTWRALLILLLSGLLLTITEPSRELMNNAFRLKMLMVLMLVALTLAMQRASLREPDYWNASLARRRAGVVLGVSSLVLCVAIVVAGRLIAYI